MAAPEWDPPLFKGTAAYYAQGRTPYPAGVADALRAELSLDGEGRLLDVGCGPGSLTLVLAPMFEQAVGVDRDPDMIEQARQRSDAAAVAKCAVAWHAG